jgi:hypothetical protein
MHIPISLINLMNAISFRKKNFHCTIRLSKEIKFCLWERPGLWCSQKMLNKILEDVRSVAAQQDGKMPEYGILKGEKNDLDNRVIAIAYDVKSKKPIGFAAQIYLEVEMNDRKEDVLHLGLVCVAKDFRGNSISGILSVLPNLIILMKRKFKSIRISNISQVPSVIGNVAYYYDNVFPNPLSDHPQRPKHKIIAEQIFNKHKAAFGVGDDAWFNSEHQIICNSYTGGSDELKKKLTDCQMYRDSRVNNYCEQNLDYSRGDDILQIGKLSDKSIDRFMKGLIFKKSKGYLRSYQVAIKTTSRMFTFYRSVKKTLHV